MMLRDLTALARPSHWLKNFFIFVPLIYSKMVMDGERVVLAFVAFGAFCFLSSAVYVINDIADRAADAEHPAKHDRPIASGRISVTTGVVLSGILLAAATVLASLLPWKAAALIGVYLLINVGYSAGLKHVVILDVFIIATGFMLRVLVGAYAIEVAASNWLVLCTLFLSLFLGIAKRRSELANVSRGSSRKVLDEYTPELIRTIMIVSVTGSIVSYTLYTMSDHVISFFGTEKLIYTVPIVMYGIFRYLHLDEQRGSAENPVTVVSRDPSLLLTALIWGAASFLIIYWQI